MPTMITRTCSYCNNHFTVNLSCDNNPKSQNASNRFCSIKCRDKFRQNRVTVSCTECSKSFDRTPSKLAKSKSGNHFCSRSCSGSYNNRNRKHGHRRSKIEAWIEEKLKAKYPNLDIRFNEKEHINSELDIFIPSMFLAFELNGIFHYEPIFGKKNCLKFATMTIANSKHV